MSHYKHWIVTIDEAHIVWLGFDRADERVNSINDEVLDELNTLLHEISTMNQAKGLILYGCKSKGFIAGADVHLIAGLETPLAAVDFLKKGQAVFSRLEQLGIPTVAMVDGFCMGGGTELILACDYRLASDAKETCFALPEILLGFHPGWGGTVRLPRLIGGFHALTEMMLTGRAVSTQKAKRLGLVDDVVPLRQLKRAAIWYVKNQPEKQDPSFLQGLSNVSFIKPLIAKFLRYQVSKKIKQNHYPAPFALIDLWEKDKDLADVAYQNEVESVHRLLMENETARQLIRVFLLKERLKGFAQATTAKYHHVHVIGAGVMGGDIAAWCAQQGLKVTLQDQSYERIAPAIARAHQLFKKKFKQKRQCQAAMDRLIPDLAGIGVRSADVIIEAVSEQLKIKQAVMAFVEEHARPDAIIATNTSSIPLEEMNQTMRNPERLVGIHFFNPVPKMELVEIVKSQQTSPTVMAAAMGFVGRISRLPLPVLSSPGFLVNRVLMPYLLECVQLLEDGYSFETIDEAAESFGMMMGPVELIDTVGLDVCLAVAENLTTHFGGHVPKRFYDMVKEGRLGRKTNRGFYEYNKQGRPIKQKVSNRDHHEEIAHRLILRMINESLKCLQEGVVADADLLDAGMIFATGFAPFRGGPMSYAKSCGKDTLNALMVRLETQYGERFKIKAEEHIFLSS